jgi:hypothetical protein
MNIDERTVLQTLGIASKIRATQESHPNHYSFLVGQSIQFLAFQIISKELTEAVTGKIFKGKKFIRLPNPEDVMTKEQLFRRFPSIKLASQILYKNQQSKEEGCSSEDDSTSSESSSDTGSISSESSSDEDFPGDTLPEIGSQIISASLSLETFSSLDSCLFVFLQNLGMSELHKKTSPLFAKFIRECFSHYKIEKRDYLPFWKELLSLPSSKKGLITQVLIPKSSIRKYAYVSCAGGFVDIKKDQKIEEFLEKFARERSGRVRFKNKQNDQVRLLAGAVMNSNELVMKRYSLIPKTAVRAYKERVRAAISKILHRHATKKTSPCTFEERVRAAISRILLRHATKRTSPCTLSRAYRHTHLRKFRPFFRHKPKTCDRANTLSGPRSRPKVSLKFTEHTYRVKNVQNQSISF